MASEFDNRKLGPPAKIVKGKFDGPMLGRQAFASIEDANGKEIVDFSVAFVVLRARLWLLMHGYDPFLPRR